MCAAPRIVLRPLARDGAAARTRRVIRDRVERGAPLSVAVGGRRRAALAPVVADVIETECGDVRGLKPKGAIADIAISFDTEFIRPLASSPWR